MRVIGTIATWLGGLGFLGFAIAFLVAPDATLASAGMAMTGPGASDELRAFYGGAELALGGLIVMWALQPGRRRDALLLTFVSYAAIGGCRALGMALAGTTTSFLTFALATELTLAVLSGLALLARR